MQQVERKITVDAETGSLSTVREFVEAAVREAGFDERQSALIVLAIDEAVTNIIQYAARHEARDTVTVSIDADDVRLRAAIDETLTVFDVPSMPNGAVEAYMRREGAYCVGIFLIRCIMDEVTYHFKKGFENSLTMIKYRKVI